MKKRKRWKAAAILVILAVFLFSARDLRLYVVLSGSMEPVLPVGAVAVIDQSDIQVQAGDIAAFSREEQTVTHRIIKSTDEGYVTKGDANKEVDTGTVAPEDILGTVVFCIPYAGYGVMWLQEYRVLVIAVIILMLFLTLLFSPSEKGQEKKTKRPEKKEKNKRELKL